ncbi:MAG: MBOAT family protein, partial [Eubacterium sp.]|nr:MBOAT family protein [Eubacterium sp.]
MSILSLPFLGFLTIVFILYYALPRRYQWVVLLVSGILFYYLCSGLKAGLFIVITIITTFAGARRIDRLNREQKQAVKEAGKEASRDEKKAIKAGYQKRTKRVLVLTLLLNFGILAVLKYGNFVMENVRALIPSAGAGASLHLLLPLGIS